MKMDGRARFMYVKNSKSVVFTELRILFVCLSLSLNYLRETMNICN